MSETTPLTARQFSQRLAELCLRSNLSAIPKKELDQHILLKSAVLLLGDAAGFTEKEVTDRLDQWTRQVCVIQNFDRVSLRRWLIDTGYLLRSRDGASYQIARPAPRPEFFEAEIDHLDVLGVLAEARAEIARRKQEFMQKAKER